MAQGLDKIGMCKNMQIPEHLANSSYKQSFTQILQRIIEPHMKRNAN